MFNILNIKFRIMIFPLQDNLLFTFSSPTSLIKLLKGYVIFYPKEYHETQTSGVNLGAILRHSHPVVGMIMMMMMIYCCFCSKNHIDYFPNECKTGLLSANTKWL